MKHQSFTRSAHPKTQDSKLDGNRHKSLASKSRQQSASDRIHKKPLAGRIFYLDLPCNKKSLTLESDIKSLGGMIEKFFSKEISYLVSCKPEARNVHRLVQDSPVPSPDSGLSSPNPGSRRDSHGHRGSSQGTADNVVVSRGKSLVEKVVREQDRIQMNSILANALEWGVKILYVDDLISYMDKKKSILAKIRSAAHTVKKVARPEPTEETAFQKCKAGQIDQPFVKVEDSSRHYRPIYLPMANMPVCNLRSAAPCSPFLVEENKEDSGKKTKLHGSAGDQKERGRKARLRGREGKGRWKGGYCECCIVKYDSLQAHLQSEQHQAFSKSEEYLVVDRVIAGLACDFVHINSQKKRLKCSVSSSLVIPGAAIKREDEVDEVVTDEFTLWGCQNIERSVRKRYRELPQSSRKDPARRLDTLPKSQSKRGSFEWQSGANAAFHKDFGLSLSNTRQDCLSDMSRIPTRISSELQTSQSPEHVTPLESASAGFKTTCPPFGAITAAETSGASESFVISEHKTTQKTFDITGFSQIFKERLPLISDHEPIRTEDPSDITHGPEGSSKVHELTSMDIPSGILQRRVRSMRRRRTASAEALRGVSGTFVESLTPQSEQASMAESLPVPYLWQLFQSSDGEDEDFKGFCN